MLCKNARSQEILINQTSHLPSGKARSPGRPFLARLLAVCCGAGCLLHWTDAATLNFELLTWNDTDATDVLPSAAGRKPSKPAPNSGDWLVFTSDDNALPANNNLAGALSHNLVDPPGLAGPYGFVLAPSLSGSLTLDLEPDNGSNWTTKVKALAYAGQANSQMSMNQFLVTPGSPATANSAFNVDGAGNSGHWHASMTANWSLEYDIDFYFATSADGNPDPGDIDATFNDKIQTGHLIPVSQLTAEGLSGVTFAGDFGFYSGDLKQYLITEIAPRLPGNATYLLLTQMGKTSPNYTEAGLPIGLASAIGNFTMAYSTQTLAPPPQIQSLHFENGQPVIQFTGTAAQAYQIQRSSDLNSWQTVPDPLLTYPTAGTVAWVDPAPVSAQQFYRVLALTP